ncbi:MAG: OmpH family outer membrane protein [Bacteroidota bacterium]
MENTSDKLENQNTKGRIPFLVAGLNIVLIIGLVALYILFFASERGGFTKNEDGKTTLEEKIEQKMPAIAYVNSDVIVEEYYLSDVLSSQLDEEKRRLENEFSKKQRNFQSEVEKFQRDVQTGAISSVNAQQKEQELMMAQQELYNLNEQFSEQLIRKEMEMQEQLTDSISMFLERYNEDKDYDFIFGYARGGGILLANPDLDITDEVIEMLKEEETK